LLSQFSGSVYSLSVDGPNSAGTLREHICTAGTNSELLRLQHNPWWRYLTILDSERSPELPSGFLNWFGKFLEITDTHVLHRSSMDGYLFLRLLRVLCALCFTGCLITWPILLPIHATGGAGNTQLDMLSFSNVTDPTRYFAHAVVGCVFFSRYTRLLTT